MVTVKKKSPLRKVVYVCFGLSVTFLLIAAAIASKPFITNMFTFLPQAMPSKEQKNDESSQIVIVYPNVRPSDSVKVCGFTLVAKDSGYRTMNDGSGEVFLEVEMKSGEVTKREVLVVKTPESEEGVVSFNGCSLQALSISEEKNGEAKILVKKLDPR